MTRPTFSHLGQRATKNGILREAGKMCDDFSRTLYETFQNFGDYAIAYMTGEVEEPDWIGKTRDYKNIANDDPGVLFLLDFLAEEAEVIRSKKGFVFCCSLYTPREHRDCGSSGYDRFAGPNGEYDDMPVPLANAILGLRKDYELMTVEMVRNARELVGMPTIDDKGYVTGQTIKHDSYDFLPPESVSEVKDRERRIGAAADVVSSHVIETQTSFSKRFLRALRRYLENVGEGEKRLSTPDLMNLMPYIRDARTGNYIDFSGIAAGAKAVAFGLGYRDTILTPQEVIIAGRKVNNQKAPHPHVPIGRQTGELDKALAARRRAEEQWFTVYTDLFVGYNYYHTISLEPLADDGSTVRGPQLVDRETGQPQEKLMGLYKDKHKEVPFARPGDWFHRP